MKVNWGGILSHTIAGLVVFFIIGADIVVAFVRGASLDDAQAKLVETRPQQKRQFVS
jgi:hypothetical protein